MSPHGCWNSINYYIYKKPFISRKKCLLFDLFFIHYVQNLDRKIFLYRKYLLLKSYVICDSVTPFFSNIQFHNSLFIVVAMLTLFRFFFIHYYCAFALGNKMLLLVVLANIDSMLVLTASHINLNFTHTHTHVYMVNGYNHFKNGMEAHYLCAVGVDLECSKYKIEMSELFLMHFFIIALEQNENLMTTYYQEWFSVNSSRCTQQNRCKKKKTEPDLSWIIKHCS